MKSKKSWNCYCGNYYTDRWRFLYFMGCLIEKGQMVQNGKILVISLSDDEEQVFNQIVKWLSDKLNCSAVALES